MLIAVLKNEFIVSIYYNIRHTFVPYPRGFRRHLAGGENI